MGATRTVELPPTPTGEERTTEMTNLEWALQFVKLKIQEMIFNGRKTDQCGVILFGSEETDNIIHEKNGGYQHVSEYIPITQPNSTTLAKLDALQPSENSGDPIDALIVGIETQDIYLEKKRTWTRKIVLVTDGQSPMEIEDWEATVKKMNALAISFTVIGIDFDDDEFPFHEEDKSSIKVENEAFYHKLTSALDNGLVGTCAFALQEIARPDIKQTKSALIGTVLRLGDVDVRPDEAIEILVKASKCTALARPKSWKKFGRREKTDDQMQVEEEEDMAVFAQLKMRTEYYIDHSAQEGEEQEKMDTGSDDEEDKDKNLEQVQKEQLIRGFKYGSTYAPCPDGQFPRLNTRKGIDICGFFHAKNFRRELAMGEVQYIWADPGSPQQQVALSSIVQAMYEKGVLAIARWVSRDGMDPKMGVLAPSVDTNIDFLLWVQMPFADDVRKYTFASLENLVSKNGESVAKHPYLPTEDQLEAMGKFIDSMDIMDSGETDDEGKPVPWYDTRQSYNPAIHRTKQALFHSAVVNDVASNPLPPPHPELLKYINPPRWALKESRDAIAECKAAFKVKEVPKKVVKVRKDGHVRAMDEDEDMLLLDKKPAPSRKGKEPAASQVPVSPKLAQPAKKPTTSDSETEEESDQEPLLLEKRPFNALPTPERSMSPDVDPGRSPGRIIGSTYPLRDFKTNLAQGDVVTKAVEDMGVTIKEVVLRPFASRRHTEMIECMIAMRDTCLKEDEIDAWNAFLKDLKESCLKEAGNPEFWQEVQNIGRSISLISAPEAKKLGGHSEFSESASEAVSRC
ncbi:SPOC like C-terminal domain-containing protein [Suillus clintonianus]|uniref:SPOC like C-terminal domain-containing protein n=1 Tax=Suillus clintonianus TaxID=1904413 RepID=UPI001B86E21B|nr:SPOC like C-terminal domain-containing protein [Suillus clintonianus]KAG2132365.1 SPOC like C-terminal domain-containing protein [Suillus clintonianus]